LDGEAFLTSAITPARPASMVRRRLGFETAQAGAQGGRFRRRGAGSRSREFFLAAATSVGLDVEDLVQDVGHGENLQCCFDSASLKPSQTNRPPTLRLSHSETAGFGSAMRALALRGEERPAHGTTTCR
jgi:hypothetical protein